MDITPNSQIVREQIEALPLVRRVWNIPLQPQWANRAITLLKKANPELIGVIQSATDKTVHNLEAELGIVGADPVVVSRAQWETSLNRVGHAAGAAAVIGIGEALAETRQLESGLRLPDSSGPDN